MSLFNLVEKHYTVRLTAHCFGELSALIIAYIPRRCTDQARHTEFLLILTHVDTRHHILVVEEVLGQSFRQFCLSNACRSQEDEGCNRSFGVLKSCPTASDGIANGIDSLVLSDDTFMQFVLQVK